MNAHVAPPRELILEILKGLSINLLDYNTGLVEKRLQIWKTDPSVGTESVNSASAAPMKVICAWNWRDSAAGAALAREAKMAVIAVRVKVFILRVWSALVWLW